ncbi:GNAT family N-acetyltransferase [Anaerosinus sp.]|uniref:GNAT family N-acetyltransferase n=1 Tax=Selenobaculum sp. TaxID=3074374 RepID=UPI003AB5A846
MNELIEVKKRDGKLADELFQVWQKSVEATHLFLTEKEKVEMLFLHPDFFRHGIGTELVNYAIHKCKVTHVDVNEQNRRAYEFYLSVGFKVESRSELDEQGNPFSILHLKLKEQSC